MREKKGLTSPSSVQLLIDSYGKKQNFGTHTHTHNTHTNRIALLATMNGFATRRWRSRYQKLVVALEVVGLFMLMIFQQPQLTHSFTTVSSRRRRPTSAMPTMTYTADGSGGAVDAVATTTTSTSSTSAAAATSRNNTPMQCINGLSEIVDRYDTFILDMWGVLHDGKRPYRSVLTTLQRLHDKNKRLVILSNSSKRQNQSIRMLTKLGFDVSWFDHILTSGEYTHGLLNNNELGNNNAWLQRHHYLHQKPKTCFCLGSGDGDRQYIESCTCWSMVDSVEQASLQLARGTFTIHETVFSDHHTKSDNMSSSSYMTALTQVLQIAAQRKLPMIIANPDFIRPDGDRSPMPGSIGAWYRQALVAKWGNSTDIDDLVYAIGKPFPIVFDAIFKELLSDDDNDKDIVDQRRKSRVCMVGDALETDILGGQRSGIDTVWVTADGIHECNSTTAEQVLNDWDHGIEHDNDNSPQFRYSQRGEMCRPTYQLNHFQW
jgi:HAD superfamily hydrolase (TIGR01459 family)